MTDDTQMKDTMDQIYGQGLPSKDQKDLLLKDIKQIETEIKEAQKVVQLANDEQSSMLGISPELANERQRDIVFLKRKLEKTKTEYDEIAE